MSYDDQVLIKVLKEHIESGSPFKDTMIEFLDKLGSKSLMEAISGNVYQPVVATYPDIFFQLSGSLTFASNEVSLGNFNFVRVPLVWNLKFPYSVSFNFTGSASVSRMCIGISNIPLNATNTLAIGPGPEVYPVESGGEQVLIRSGTNSIAFISDSGVVVWDPGFNVTFTDDSIITIREISRGELHIGVGSTYYRLYYPVSYLSSASSRYISFYFSNTSGTYNRVGTMVASP